MKVNKDLTATASENLIVDELYTDVGVSGFNLEHDFFFGDAELEIWTMSGQAGILLIEDTDYTLSDIDDTLTGQATRNVYKVVTIDNATYQSGDIYFTYQACADFVDADDRYMVTREDGQYWDLNSSGGFDLVVSDDITLKDQYLTSAIPLSETGTTGLSGFTATSIVGAINEGKGLMATSIPGSPISGSFYFNDATDTLYIYNGTSWVSTVLT